MSITRVAFAVVIAALLGIPRVGAAADDVAVIVNKSNPIATLTMAQLRKILLSQGIRWASGAKIVVWMTKPGQRERSGTLKLVCGMSETDFTLHFVHASFVGDDGDLPKTAGSSALVRQSIAGAVNGVGIVWASQADDSVKVVAIEGSRPGQAAYKLTVK